ncbi:hypothetical protein F5I97DRAFT_1831861 [Phlebopus sp. FC_14]|nr:hypothetical protein F5I97DRAFT_1831861 [Phlebopus sp. FC_14]
MPREYRVTLIGVEGACSRSKALREETQSQSSRVGNPRLNNRSLKDITAIPSPSQDQKMTKDGWSAKTWRMNKNVTIPSFEQCVSRWTDEKSSTNSGQSDKSGHGRMNDDRLGSEALAASTHHKEGTTIFLSWRVSWWLSRRIAVQLGAASTSLKLNFLAGNGGVFLHSEVYVYQGLVLCASLRIWRCLPLTAAIMPATLNTDVGNKPLVEPL